MLTIEQKYRWLCKQMKVTQVDLWEGDAMLSFPNSLIYFQFGSGAKDVLDVDKAVERCMGEVV